MMNALRVVFGHLFLSHIHRQQSIAESQVAQAHQFMQQQKTTTDVLAEQAWKAMGGR